MTTRIALAALALAACCLGQPALPDSAGRPQAGKAAERRSPGLAMALSLVVPGGGQVYTGQYWKAAAIAPVEVGLGWLALRQHNFARRSLAAGDTTAYRFHRDWRTTWLWWTGAVVVFSMADAYVSARLFGFERQMQFADSAERLRAGRRLGVELGPARAGLALEF